MLEDWTWTIGDIHAKKYTITSLRKSKPLLLRAFVGFCVGLNSAILGEDILTNHILIHLHEEKAVGFGVNNIIVHLEDSGDHHLLGPSSVFSILAFT